MLKEVRKSCFSDIAKLNQRKIEVTTNHNYYELSKTMQYKSCFSSAKNSAIYWHFKNFKSRDEERAQHVGMFLNNVVISISIFFRLFNYREKFSRVYLSHFSNKGLSVEDLKKNLSTRLFYFVLSSNLSASNAPNFDWLLSTFLKSEL